MTEPVDVKQNKPEQTPPPSPPAAPPPPRSSRSRILWLFSFGLLILGIVWVLYWFFYLQYCEFTDDAYANGNMISINSAIPGSVVAFFADDTDLVKEGQLLALLDCTEYQVAYEKELATLASVVLQVRQLYDNVKVSRANLETKQIALEKAQYDFDNRSRLVDAKAVTGEDFVHSKDDLLTAQSDFKLAEQQLHVALDAAGNTSVETHPQIEQQKGNVRTAYYNLQHCSIFAPATGYIAQRSVNVGQWATPATDLMAIIPTDYVWVDANFKETQLTYMRIGQPARVWFDIYGSKVEYKGVVLGIASGSGSVFSIIPPQNATGNWIKIVQRLPVRISLDPETVKNYPSRLGISAEVHVDITNQDLPMLALTPPTKPVGTTRVFDIDLEKVNTVIDEIIRKNLKQEQP